MPNYERKPHEPDDGRVFDGGEDDEDAEGSRLPVVIVISLIVLAAFGGVVWIAYNKGVAHGRADVPAQVVAQNVASEPPAVAPGNGAIPAKRIKVYQQPAGSDEDAEQEIATAPPTPLTKAQAAVAPPPALRAQPAEMKPAPVRAAPVHEAKVAVPPPAAVTQSALPPVKAQATAAGAYLLQIGAYKSQSDADAAWKTYRAKHAVLLSGFASNVQKADLGGKGVWYRLRVGSFADKNAAAALCDRLKAEGAACFPAK